MSKVLSRIMLALCAVCALGYAGFQLWRYLYVDYETVAAREAVVEDKLTAQAIAIRDEEVLPGAAKENLVYLYTDGAHVAKDAPVARYVTDRSQITDQMRRDELQKELQNLQSLSGTGDALILQTDTVAQRVYADIDAIAGNVARGALSETQERRLEILNQLNRRNLATAKEGGYDSRIAQLEEEILTLGASFTDEEAVITPEAGYFTKTVDGFEELLTPENMEQVPVDEYASYISASPEDTGAQVGKMIRSHIWYCAVVVNAADLGRFQEGATVELDFGLAGTKPFDGEVHKILEDSAGARGVVLLRCDEMSEELSNLRTHKVDISFQRISGYKLPSGCIRYNKGERGVYVLETTVIRFKPVEILYENEQEGYVILSESYGERAGLQRFDEVIIGGNGLEDGKIIKL